jgi:DNA-binding IclR family transcriptional regulator
MPDPLVKSAARVFAIFELFDRQRRPLRLKDIANELQQPTSSTAALLKSILSLGYLSYNAQTRAYMPTPRLAQVAGWVPFEAFEQGIVMDALRQLQRSTGETVILAAQHGIYVEYEQTVNATEGMTLRLAPGTRRLTVQTGTGWLLLNQKSRAEAIDVYEETIASGQLDRRKFSRAAFLSRLDDHAGRIISFVKARDVLIPTAHWGGGMISALIPVPPGHRALAVGIGGPADRLEANFESISSALTTALATIGERLNKQVSNT